MAKFNAKQLAVIATAATAAFNKGNADTAFKDATKALSELNAATAMPILAVEVAKKYGTTVVSKVAERGIKAGQTVWVFGAGSSNGKAEAKDTNARMAFGRLCKAAWGEASNDTDAAEDLMKALKRVIAGRAKLSKADLKKFTAAAKAEGVSFV